MSNPPDPSQPDPQQERGQSANSQQPGDGYDANPAQGEPQQAQQSSWQQAEPTPIDWHTAPPQADQAPWRGPAAFAAPAGPDRPWISGGTAQTAQEVANQWHSSQEAQQVASPSMQGASSAPVAEHYQAPGEQYQPPVADPAPHQQAPQQAARDTEHNEAATVTTPAPADSPAGQEPEALTIGRGRENTIMLDDMLVSRRHVRITADSDGLVLEDVGSRNGTYVNGLRVERTHLSEGDRIGIGGSTFEVRDGWLLNV